MQYSIPGNMQAVMGIPVGKLQNHENRIKALELNPGGGGTGFTYTDELLGTGDGDGSGGGTTQFTLAHAPTSPSGIWLIGWGGTNSSWKYIQGASYDYTVSGTTITFLTAPLSGIKIFASYA